MDSEASTIKEMDVEIPSGDLKLAGWMKKRADSDTALIWCHGMPHGTFEADERVIRSEAYAKRVADQRELTVLTMSLRGVGSSDGDFSLKGWVDDVKNAIRWLCGEHGVKRVLLTGMGVGGSLGVLAAAGVQDALPQGSVLGGIATFGARAGFEEWASNPTRMAEYCREIGIIRSEAFPQNLAEWSQEFVSLSPVGAASRLSPLPFLLVHGGADSTVPFHDARALHRAAPFADLRRIDELGHRMRDDPRVIALLLGWIEQRLVDHA